VFAVFFKRRQGLARMGLKTYQKLLDMEEPLIPFSLKDLDIRIRYHLCAFYGALNKAVFQ